MGRRVKSDFYLIYPFPPNPNWIAVKSCNKTQTPTQTNNLNGGEWNWMVGKKTWLMTNAAKPTKNWATCKYNFLILKELFSMYVHCTEPGGFCRPSRKLADAR